MSQEPNQQLFEEIEIFENILASATDDVQTMELLQGLYASARETEKFLEMSRGIFVLHMENEKYSPAIATCEKVLTILPENEEFLNKMIEVSSISGISHSMTEEEPSTSYHVQGAIKLGEYFISQKFISKEELERLIGELSKNSGAIAPSLIDLAGRLHIMDTEYAVTTLSERLKIPYMDLSCYEIDRQLALKLSRDIACARMVMIFDQIKDLCMGATLNPLDKDAQMAVESLMGKKIQWHIVMPEHLQAQLKSVYKIQ